MGSKRAASYILSERFIHDELMRRATIAVDKLPQYYRRDKEIQSSLIVWPADDVKMDDGAVVGGMIYAQLPESMEDRARFLTAAVKRTGPYAMLVVEQNGDVVKAIFESQHGTRSWTFHLERHGDVKVFSKPTIEDDVESLNLLWSKHQGTA